MHPQSHICWSMSCVGQVSWTRSRKVSIGQLQSHYATMIQNTKNYNKMIINAHIHMCSNRAYQLRIEMALVPLMGSYYRKQKISYAWTHKLAKNIYEMVATETNRRRLVAGIMLPHKHCRWRVKEDARSRRSHSLDVVDVVVHLTITRLCTRCHNWQCPRTRSHVRLVVVSSMPLVQRGSGRRNPPVCEPQTNNLAELR
jgi:hypothetical protein